MLLGLDTANEPATARDALAFGSFFVLGTVASVAAGALLTRAWAPSLPIVFVVAALAAGDVRFELPLWAFLLVCAPLASTAIWLGSAARRFVEAPGRADGVIVTLALWVLAFPYAMVAGLRTAEPVGGRDAGRPPRCRP